MADEIATRLDAAFAPSDYCEPSSNIEALEYYWRGKRLLTSYVFRPETEEAIELLKKAVALDPDFGLAYAELSAGYMILPSKIIDMDERRDRAPVLRGLTRDTARTAMRLCPTAAFAYRFATPSIAGVTHPVIESEIRYRNALQMETQNPMLNSIYIQHLEALGLFRRALQVAENTFRANPLAPRAIIDLGRIASNLGDGERGLSLARRANEVGPASPNAFFLHLMAAVAINDPVRSPAIVDEAIADYEDRLHPSLASNIEMAGMLAGWTGRDADPEVRQGRLELAASVTDGAPGFAAVQAAWAGEIDTALEHLEAGAESGALIGNALELWMDTPGMDAVRADPRFVALIERFQLPDYWREYGWPDGKCRPLGDTAICD